MDGTQKSVIDWLATGETGVSSMTMAFWLGFKVMPTERSAPSDPADFDRCLRLLECAPGLRARIGDMAQVSPQWAKIAAAWREIEKCHLDEAGLGWSKTRSAPKTYALMKKISGVCSVGPW